MTSNSVDLSSRWKAALSQSLRSTQALLDHLQLTPDQLPPLVKSPRFRVLVPESFLHRMEPQNPFDPLLMQVLPFAAELQSAEGFSIDAVGDSLARKTTGLIHKYQGRVLLMLSGNCAINCRYCFRQHYPYSEEPKSLAQWEPALQAIQADPSIHEVIFSGGDPLLQSTRRLAELTDRLANISHIQRLRIHSRLPIVLPSRIDEEFLDWMESIPLTTALVLHSNHAQELQADCADAIEKLASMKLHLLNQSVLLKGINDDEQTMQQLCERLIELGVQPYYTHQLDRVLGTAHFEVPISRGLEIHEYLRAHLPGYAIPRYVQEIQGEASKTVLY